MVASFATTDNVANYLYDQNGQLVSVDNSTLADETFDFDSSGNRDSTGYVVGDDNQMLSDGTWNYTYDKEGNRISKTNIATGEVVEYTWDHRNRLVEVETVDSSGVTVKDVVFTYDPLNRRIAETVDEDGAGPVDPVSEYFIQVQEDLQPEEQEAGITSQTTLDDVALVIDETGDVTSRYLHGPAVDQVLAEEFGDTGSADDVNWYLTDNQGSVREVVQYDEATGVTSTVKTITYGAFGQVTSDSNPLIEVSHLYTGREFDTSTGMYFYRARYYDAGNGVFISQDPQSFAAGDYNLSRYVFNTPTNGTDPSGEFVITLTVVAVLTVAAAGSMHYAASQYDAASEVLEQPPSPEREAEFQRLYGRARTFHAVGNHLAVAAVAVASFPLAAYMGPLYIAGWGAGAVSSQIRTFRHWDDPAAVGIVDIGLSGLQPLVGAVHPYAAFGELGGSVGGGSINWLINRDFYGPGYDLGSLAGGILGGSFQPGPTNSAWWSFSARWFGAEAGVTALGGGAGYLWNGWDGALQVATYTNLLFNLGNGGRQVVNRWRGRGTSAPSSQPHSHSNTPNAAPDAPTTTSGTPNRAPDVDPGSTPGSRPVDADVDAPSRPTDAESTTNRPSREDSPASTDSAPEGQSPRGDDAPTRTDGTDNATTPESPRQRNGRQSGAGSTDDADEAARWDQAETAYESIRQSTTDVEAIAQNTGLPERMIRRVKNHVFVEEHWLDRYVEIGEPATMSRFDANPDISDAWRRLEGGTHTPEDIDLLFHEFAESVYMSWLQRNGQPPSYTQSHEAANQLFPSPLE